MGPNTGCARAWESQHTETSLLFTVSTGADHEAGVRGLSSILPQPALLFFFKSLL